ncbi:MAG: diguanylate cyclase [Propionivibrio sp.]
MRSRETGKHTVRARAAFLRLDRVVQSLREKSMGAGFAAGVTVLVFAAIVVSSEVLSRFREADEESQRRAATLAFASELRARADRELNSVLYLASGLVGYLVVRHEHLDQREILRILQEVHNFGRHIRNFSIAVGYKISYIYPVAGNEQALGRDYRDIPAQWPAVKAAVESRRGVLTGPVDLVQGGTALIYRIPIYVGDEYWGLLATVIDMPSFEEAAFKGLDTERFDFAIRSEEPVGPGGGLLFGRSALFSDPLALRLSADVPNGKWVYAVRASDRRNASVAWGIRVAGLVLAILAAIGVHTVLRQRSELARQAGFDSLTELPNRRLFDDRLDQAIRRRARNEAGQIAAIFLDLDGFKAINDIYGHKFGDAVLRTVAARVRDEVRMGDTVARWAGDEFAIVIEDAGEPLVAHLIERLRERIGEPFDLEGVGLAVTASIGAAFYPEEAATAGRLLELADQRMFEDKGQVKAG